MSVFFKNTSSRPVVPYFSPQVTPTACIFVETLDKLTWINWSRAWWLVDKLNQVCLYWATIKMCTVGGTRGPELGTTASRLQRCKKRLLSELNVHSLNGRLSTAMKRRCFRLKNKQMYTSRRSGGFFGRNTQRESRRGEMKRVIVRLLCGHPWYADSLESITVPAASCKIQILKWTNLPVIQTFILC